MIYIGGMKIESFLLICVLCALCSRCTSQSSSSQSAEAEVDDRAFRVLTDSDVLTGAEQLSSLLPLLTDLHVACVVNQTSMINSTHLVDTLLASRVLIQSIFAPEHGFRGKADAGAHIEDGVDQKTGLPIKSLHGASKKPSASDLEGIEVMVFDIQDVGVRFYTYISTLHYVMEACAENGITLIVLDRPNPAGFYFDGPILEKEHSSFVGIHPIPIVHGMTLGELARMIKGEEWANVASLDLQIIPCKGYVHQSTYILPVKPSPNLPNHQSIMLYPSLCLLEPTAYSIGRGTEAQFQVVGRPDGESGDFWFTPKPMPGAMTPKHDGVLCRGEDLRTYDISQFYQSKKLDLSFLINYLSGPQTELITSTEFFDKLAGTSSLRIALEAGLSEAEIRATWVAGLTAFENQRRPYLLYD